MAKPKRDSVREERIHEEIIVDAYGPEEQAMGWYYYLEDKIHFPFQAKCIASKVTSPLQKGESVEVSALAPEDTCSSDMLVQIRWQGRTMAVPLSQQLPSTRMNKPAKPSKTGITGWPRGTASDLRMPRMLAHDSFVNE
jgi:hypothetical protein